MNDPIIRFVKKDDTLKLVELCRLHAEFEKAEYETTRKADLLSNHLFSKEPDLFCLVAELNEELIGYASYMKQFSTWDAEFYIYMDCLFLTEESRGKGIGEEIINRIKKESKSLGCSHIQWQTPDFNIRAMKFYDRIGGTSKRKERYFLPI